MQGGDPLAVTTLALGASILPMTVLTLETEADAILHLSGAIGLLDLRDLKPGIKVVTVDNVSPGERDYPLHE